MDIDKYRIHDLEDATEVRRGVAGQPMAIESCKNSNLLVLDHTSTITVDDCSDCLILLAPCSGSTVSAAVIFLEKKQCRPRNEGLRGIPHQFVLTRPIQ
ncbi:unnamed protein product [Strongylus vulgaris]|uniref:C-CAP/cofactor C-like domain-containing protein n=1 Tax=Strongylus vulgaris TaxID=40348 RepID=A0A3P7ICH9_STRVU|nr:unnamed protein product [Strongylus vulgaris]